MATSKSWISLLGVAVLAVPAFVVLAGHDDDRPRSDAQAVSTAQTDVPRADSAGESDGRDIDDRACDDRSGSHQVNSMGRTIKLEFKVIGEDEEPTFAVSCAGRTFLIQHDVSSPDFEGALTISGELAAVDAPDRIFIAFQSMTHHTDLNEDFDATFQMDGSAIVTLGKQVKLGDLGEQSLMLTATVED